MAQSAFPALFLAVLLAGFDFGSCVRCFQCNSQQDPSCQDPFSAGRYLVDCHTQDNVNFNRLYVQPIFQNLADGVTNGPKTCHKIVFQTGTTIRTCLDSNPSDPEHSCRELARSAQAYSGDYSRQLKFCQSCDGDGCNGAGSIAASLPLALLTAAISYLFYKQ